MQRCDGDMDFEALLIHTRQEVALDLGKKNKIFLMFSQLPSGHWARRSWAGHQSWQSGHPETFVSQSAKLFPRYYMCVNNSLNHLWEDIVCSPDMSDVRVAILLTHAQYPNLHLELRIKVVLEWTKMSGIGWTRVTVQCWMNNYYATHPTFWS